MNEVYVPFKFKDMQPMEAIIEFYKKNCSIHPEDDIQNRFKVTKEEPEVFAALQNEEIYKWSWFFDVTDVMQSY